jgi:hypothetical protein
MLVEYDIVYMMRKVLKGSAIDNHLVENAIEDYEPLDFEFPDENMLLIEEEENKKN